MNRIVLKLLIVVLTTSSIFSISSQAGVFSMPHFVEPSQFSIGLEPELTLNDGAGIGANLKYTHGLSDLTNVMGVIGTGGGPRNFRLGAAGIFDFFPDTEGQPGIGLGVESIYYRRRDVGRLEFTALPYIHKSFSMESGSVDPFLSVPFGIGFREHGYDGLLSFTMGALFWKEEKMKYVMELGVDIQHSDTYIAGGFVYYH